jgi:HEAT repeat protein
MRKHFALVVVLALAVALPAAAADAPSAHERTRQALLYGIDSQVIEAIQGLAAAKDTSFTADLAGMLRDQRSAGVQKAVLDLFRDFSVRDGEERAKEILAAGSESPSDLLVSAVRYLGAIHSGGMAAALAPLVDSTDNAVASAAITTLGTVGDATSVKLLVGRLKSPDFPNAHRGEAILALGELKDKTAVEQLVAIARNSDEEKFLRMYAADSLGKIGDPAALPVLRDMFAEKDALIRLYAASAVARFDFGEAFPLLLQGLRDEAWQVREMAAKTLARPLDGGQQGRAVPILSYKAEWDPVVQVRTASLKALGEIGGGEADRFLDSLYRNQARSPDLREAALEALARKSPGAAVEAARWVVSQKTTDAAALQATARVISSLRDVPLHDVYDQLLGSRDPAVRSYAARGIGDNHLGEFRDRLKTMSESDPDAGARIEAQRALGKL